MKFYFDAPISYRIARALDMLTGHEHTVSDPEAKFGDPSLKDEEFLPKLRAEGDWIVVTADRGKRDGNWHVWMSCGLTVVFLKKGWMSPSLPLEKHSAKLLTYWSEIVRAVGEHPRGTCFYLSTGGRMELVSQKEHKRKR